MTRSKQRRERLQYALDRARQVVEEGEKWFSFGDPRFVDRYRKGELVVLLYLRGRWTGAGRNALSQADRYYIAVAQRAEEVSGRDREFGGGHVIALPEGGHEDEVRERSTDHENKAVFVHDVELVESPEGVIPSLIGLQVAHDLDRVWTDSSLQGLDSEPSDFERGLVVANRERFPLRVLSVRKDELPNEQVKRGAKVVNRIASEQREVARQVGIDVDAPLLAAMLAAKLRIRLFRDNVWVFVKELGDERFELLDVFLGSPYLQARPIEVRAHGVTTA